jgi:adenylate cyclase
MANEAQPRLAVILHADVVESTTLVRTDERLAHQRIQAAFRDVGALVERYGGTVNEVRGDALVAEFARASDAVLAALAAQDENGNRLAGLEDGVAPVLRMGIALGEVVIADATVTGAGVVLAQRLEQLAAPGGTCVSSAVREAVPDRLSLEFASLGDQSVKGFDEPVRAYAVSVRDGAAVPTPQPLAATQTGRPGRTLHWFAAGGAVALLATVAAVWFAPWRSPVDPVALAPTALSQAEKPSIAVLPFVNMGEDPDQEYFVDGLTEDLITDLSKISGISVISRSSTLAWKGRSRDIRAVAKALGVSHVIEGSVRRAFGRLRINAQLTDAHSGTHLWAERYDRQLNDIFALQDDVREKIVTALAINLTVDEKKRIISRPTADVEAYDLLMKGRYAENSFSREGFATAISYYEEAISADPAYSDAYARMANMYDTNVRLGWSKDPKQDTSTALQMSEKAITLDDENFFAQWTRGRILARVRDGGMRNQFQAVGSLERAIGLNPNYADAYAYISYLKVGIGEVDAAVSAIEHAMSLNPDFPFWYIQTRAVIRYMQEDYAAAIDDLIEAAERNPTALFIRWWLAAAYAQAGRQEDAEWQVEEMMVLGFESTVAELVNTSVIHHPPFVERFEEGLRKAGIPM